MFLIEDYDPWATTGIFNNEKVVVPEIDFRVLGETTAKTNLNKTIEVDLTNQKVYTYESGVKIKEYTISSGTWGRTPNGNFSIWAKLRSHKMEGGSKANGDYYYLPNVPYILFFYNDQYPKKSGFSLHGTYWHNNFGVPMSHGCINMKTKEAAELYSWAEIGTPVTIYGKYTGK
jgi:lipoprotein-anchoring transpeptidase ErfK/SrfK